MAQTQAVSTRSIVLRSGQRSKVSPVYAQSSTCVRLGLQSGKSECLLKGPLGDCSRPYFLKRSAREISENSPMLRLLLTIILPFSFSTSLAVPTPVAKAKPFKVDLILKTADGRALQHGYKAGLDLQTGKITTLSVKDWNGVELVAGDVISLISHDETVQAERLAGSQKLVWQTTQTKPQTRFVLRKVEGAEGSPIATGDRVRLQLFGDKDSYLSSNAELVHVTTPGPEQTWLVRRETFGNQAARNLHWDAGMAAVSPDKSKALYEEAFKLGALDAAGEIGMMYLEGKFGSRDMVQAAAYYRKGAEAGVPSSMFMYGVLLYLGGGVSENKREAVRWEQMASQADYYPATDKLKEWGEPLPGVAASAVPTPQTPAPAFWQPMASRNILS